MTFLPMKIKTVKAFSFCQLSVLLIEVTTKSCREIGRIDDVFVFVFFFFFNLFSSPFLEGSRVKFCGFGLVDDAIVNFLAVRKFITRKFFAPSYFKNNKIAVNVVKKLNVIFISKFSCFKIGSQFLRIITGRHNVQSSWKIIRRRFKVKATKAIITTS